MHGVPSPERQGAMDSYVVKCPARRPHAMSAVFAAILLLVALGNLPYGYYKLPRRVT